MPTLVQFGAGSIGRGFIAQLFGQAGWEVVFVEVSSLLLEALRESRGFTVWEVDDEHEAPNLISGYRAVDGRDVEAASEAVAQADLASTAVGLHALPHLAPVLFRGLASRCRPLDILVCENGATAAEDLRQAVLKEAGGSPLPSFGCVRTSIGRMAPPPREGMSPLDVRVEPYRVLPVEGAAFAGPVPSVPGLTAKRDFTLALRQKLYLHNLTHAVLAYRGIPRGLKTVPEAMSDPWLVEKMRAAARESIEALVRAHGPEARSESEAILADLERRYRNRALSDPLHRVARDPLRKLARDDRLAGAALLALDHGVRPRAIAEAILEACSYSCLPDDPSEPLWTELASQGWQAVLRRASGAAEGDPLWRLVEEAACGHE